MWHCLEDRSLPNTLAFEEGIKKTRWNGFFFTIKLICFPKLGWFKGLTNTPSQPVWTTQYPQLLVTCISNQNITQEKSSDDESLQQCAVGWEGWQEGLGGKKGRPLLHTPTSLESLGPLLGVYALCHSSIFPFPLPHSASSPLNSHLSLSFTHSSSLPVLSFSLSQGFNLWLWSSRNRDDNPRFPLLC